MGGGTDAGTGGNFEDLGRGFYQIVIEENQLDEQQIPVQTVAETLNHPTREDYLIAAGNGWHIFQWKNVYGDVVDFRSVPYDDNPELKTGLDAYNKTIVPLSREILNRRPDYYLDEPVSPDMARMIADEVLDTAIAVLRRLPDESKQ